jgi:hypothetical protein
LSDYSFTLTSPGGTYSKTWARGWDTVPLVLRSRDFAGVPLQGTWTLTIVNGSAGANTLYAGPWLFVEGTGSVKDAEIDTGGGVFHWNVYANPALVSSPDYLSALQTVKRVSHGHTVGALLYALEAEPDTDEALPDHFLPAQ